MKFGDVVYQKAAATLEDGYRVKWAIADDPFSTVLVHHISFT